MISHRHQQRAMPASHRIIRAPLPYNNHHRPTIPRLPFVPLIYLQFAQEDEGGLSMGTQNLFCTSPARTRWQTQDGKGTLRLQPGVDGVPASTPSRRMACIISSVVPQMMKGTKYREGIDY